MGVSVGVLDHFNIRTRKLADTVRFYEDIMGLEKGPRPNFAFPGAWMYSEGKAVVHLVDISKTDEPQKPDSGVVHHVAFASSGFDGMKKRLESKEMKYRLPAGSGRRPLADLRRRPQRGHDRIELRGGQGRRRRGARRDPGRHRGEVAFWAVRHYLSHLNAMAFSSRVESGSREENASNKARF